MVSGLAREEFSPSEMRGFFTCLILLAAANSMYDVVVIRTKAWSITKIFGSAALVGNDTKDLTTMEKLLTAGDLAEILGFAKRSVVNMARERPHTLPPYIKVSDSYRWRPSTVQAWMDSKSQKVQEAVPAKATEQPKRGRGRPRK